MDKELIYFVMEICIQVNTKKESLMVKVNMHGKMVKFMWGNLRMGINMVKGSGEAVKVPNAINMKVNM